MEKDEKFHRLDIEDGQIHFRIYDQEGNLQPFVLKDSTDNRHFVDWVKHHDRYTIHGE